jgi:hypothetical protein
MSQVPTPLSHTYVEACYQTEEIAKKTVAYWSLLVP